MTLLCAPVKKWISSPQVDCVEMGSIIYSPTGYPMLRHVDWNNSRGGDMVSYHNFDITPDPYMILQQMQKRHPSARYYKIATSAHSILDTFPIIALQKQGIIAISMGEVGSWTRICAPVFGAPLTYAPINMQDRNAPGQLTVQQLEEVYHFSKLNRQTTLFGLIGHPLHKSLGPLFHNEYFRKHQINSVYIAMELHPHELKEFFLRVQHLPFKGFSVTAPLKEVVIPYLDSIDPCAQLVGSVNTLVLQGEKIRGYNTDIVAIRKMLGELPPQRIVVLGSGGVARSCILAALQTDHDVTIVNRSPEKAAALSREFQCRWNLCLPSYDLLINATSSSMPILESEILPKRSVIEMACFETPFLTAARHKNCNCQDGREVFLQQAILQQQLWHSHVHRLERIIVG